MPDSSTGMIGVGFAASCGMRAALAQCYNDHASKIGHEMPMLNRTCPKCRKEASSSVGDRVVGGQLVWFESFQCPHCGCAMEGDGHGVAEFSVRQAILAETGLWGWRVSTTGPALLKTLIQIRQKLDPRKLGIGGIAAIKSKAPGILAVGTRAEIELLVGIAKDCGLESLAESVPSNAYAPLDFANFSHRSGQGKRTADICVGLEPLKCGPADVVSLGSFQLTWRWTDPQYAVFPPESLASIRPLSEAKAFEAWRRSGRFFDESFQTSFSLSKEFFLETERLYLTNSDVNLRAWLNDRLPNPNEEVLVSWRQETAALVPAKLFVDRWDDFYYPGSDDLIMWPINEAWCLFIDHEQQLLLGRNRQS